MPTAHRAYITIGVDSTNSLSIDNTNLATAMDPAIQSKAMAADGITSYSTVA